MTHDSDYCLRRAATERAAASQKGGGEALQIAGDLALAYAALAQRRKSAPIASEPAADPPTVVLVG